MSASARAREASLVGQTLGRYEVVSRLATGGMSEVWLALAHARGRSGTAGRKVALKTMLTDLAESPEHVRRFETEAAIGARLKHANLVHVFDYGRLHDRPFIAMEYVEGLTLRQLMQRLERQGRRCPMPLLLSIVVDVCRGLHSAHRLRDRSGALHVVHGDVSPENIMITRTGAAKVIDFGAAETLRGPGGPPSFVGKRAYAAPERIEGLPADRRSDVYSLGVILYEGLTGVRPFEDDHAAMVSHIVGVTPPAPDLVAPEIPTALSQVVLQALAPRADDRHRSTAALAADLAPILTSLPDAKTSDALASAFAEALPSDDTVAPLNPDAKTVEMKMELLREAVNGTREEITVVSPFPSMAAASDSAALVVYSSPVPTPEMRALVPISTPGGVRVPFAATAPPPRAVQMRLDVKRAFKLARPTLGSPPGMALFRLLRLSAFDDVTGRDDQGSGYLAGKKLGRALEPKSLDDFLALAQTLKLGLIRIPRLDDDGVHLDLYECASCTGLEKIGCPICHFEAGLFAGVLEAVTGRPVEGREITCIGGAGDAACGFELDFR